MIVASVSRSAAAVGRTSGFGQIVAVCSGDIFDHPDVQTAQLPRQPGWREHLQVREKVGPADTSDVDPWIFKPCSSALSPASKKLIPLTVLPFDLDQARVLFATEAAMPTPSPRSPTISPRIAVTPMQSTKSAPT
jgi:hypothetical protein